MALPTCRICGRQVIYTSRGTLRHADGLWHSDAHAPELLVTKDKDKSMSTGWKIFLFIVWPVIAVAVLGFVAILLVVGWVVAPFMIDSVMPPPSRAERGRSRVFFDGL